MRYKGFFVKILPAACAAGILIVAGVMCQKPKSANTEAVKAAMPAMQQVVSDSTKTAGDTSVKKADSVAVSKKKADSAAMTAVAGYYTCPMHPKIQQAKPGKCPICKMDLVFKNAAKTTTTVKGTTHSK